MGQLETFKKNVTLMSWPLSLCYGHVILVGIYPVLTADN